MHVGPNITSFIKSYSRYFRFSPIGVGSIIASKLVEVKDVKGTMENFGLFVITVTITSIIFGVVFLNIIYTIISRQNPFRLMRSMMKPMLTSFGTGSR